jgi:hypothetical protein
MNGTGLARLEFNPKLNKLSKKKELRGGLSVAVQVGNTLWVTNDETISLERLSFQGTDSQGVCQYGEHTQFSLNDYLALPVPPLSDPKDIAEADLEGADCKDGYLWLVGSHSLARKKVAQADSAVDNFRHLAEVSSAGNRFLLARIPLVEQGGTCTLEKEVQQGSSVKRVAAQLPGTAESDSLTEALKEDDHLRKFLTIPCKDNGLDIEGLAVAGTRVFIGLRGPVLRGWAVVLELEPEVNEENPAELKLKAINPNNPYNPKNPTYWKHFLDLDGLGVRDLCVHGSDLLVLAGPTMELDGPAYLFRWKGGAQPQGESIVLRNALPKIRDIPYGQGEDHAEGLTLFSPDGHEASSVLIVYDSASKSRQTGENGIMADIFPL